MPRKYRQRGKQVKKRGIYSKQVCATTALDKQENLIMESLNLLAYNFVQRLLDL